MTAGGSGDDQFWNDYDANLDADAPADDAPSE
jgi:hypothetical protein